MSEVDDSLKKTIENVGSRWGGRSDFKIEIVSGWREVIKNWKTDGGKVVHLTMYGLHINDAVTYLRQENTILVVIGAGKVPRELYDLADYNIAIGNQPHSEVAALSIFLDRMFKGKQFEKDFKDAKLRIIPTAKGKTVRELS
jgi:tRNA (cytidine56-2'-O)-methyltransferase